MSTVGLGLSRNVAEVKEAKAAQKGNTFLSLGCVSGRMWEKRSSGSRVEEGIVRLKARKVKGASSRKRLSSMLIVLNFL